MEENQTQFAAIKILVNVHGIVKNEREHTNVICISNLASYMHYGSLLKTRVFRSTLVLLRSKAPILCSVIPITHSCTFTESKRITAKYQSLKKKRCWEWEFESLKQTENPLPHGIYWPNSTVISVDNLHQLPIRSLKIKDRNLNVFWKSWHCQAKYVHMPDSFLLSSRGCSLLKLFSSKIYMFNLCD